MQNPRAIETPSQKIKRLEKELEDEKRPRLSLGMKTPNFVHKQSSRENPTTLN